MELYAQRLKRDEPQIVQSTPRLVEISSCLKDMTESPSFFRFHPDGGVSPRFAKELDKVFHLGSWPLLRASHDNHLLASSIECYCAIAPHGQIHIAEIFFANESGYLGTHKAFTLQYPDGQYDSRHDDVLMSEMASRVFGFGGETKT